MTDIPSGLTRDRAAQPDRSALETLLAPLSTEAPCGPNLEFDRRFSALEAASRGKPEAQYGTFIEKAVQPDWDEVHRQAVDLFRETKDLRVAALWTRALTHLFGLDGTIFGLRLIDGLIATWWDELHPQLDPEDDHDPAQRWHTLLVLDSASGLVGDLRETVVVSAETGKPLVETVTTLADRIRALDAAWSSWPGEVFSRLLAAIRRLGEARGPTERPPEGPVVDHVLEQRRDAALDALLAWVDGAGLDLASVCRRFGRLEVDDFAGLVRQVAVGWDDEGSSPRHDASDSDE